MDRFLRPRPRAVGVLIAGAVAAAAACSSAPVQRTGGAALDRRAALARLVVVNRTDRTLAISFRYAGRPVTTVEVGRVGPGDTAEMAPVPADEPIILEANGAGLHRRLEPRTLEIDAVWTWTIESGTERTRTHDR